MIVATLAGAIIWLSEVDVPIDYGQTYSIEMSDEERYPDEGEEGWETLGFKSTTELQKADFNATNPVDQYYTYVNISNPGERDITIITEIAEPIGWDREMGFTVKRGIVDPIEMDVDEWGSITNETVVSGRDKEQFTVIYTLDEEAPESDNYEVKWQFKENDIWIADAAQPITYPDETLIVKTEETTEITENSATLNGNLTYLRGYNDAEVYFQWREEGDGEWNETSKETLSEPGNFSKTIDSLTSNTSYEYRTVAMNSTKYYGSHFNFTTNQIDSGDGTKSNPYRITNWYDLQAIWNDLDAYYELVNDLNDTSSGYRELIENKEGGWTPIGNQDNPFTGAFNGSENQISDLMIDKASENNVGLFGHVGRSANGTTIKEVCVVNSSVTGERGVGALIGRVTGNSTTNIIRCCARNSTVNGTGATGGLVGSHNSWRETPGATDNPTVEQSFAEVEVGVPEGKEGSDKFGGLVGCTQKGTIENSYALGTVTARDAERVGGLAGCAERRGEILTSYSTGNVTGDQLVGGLLGNIGTKGIGNNGKVTDSYFDTDPDNGIGTQLSTNEMKGSNANASNNMGGFDFDDIWYTVENGEDIDGTSITPDEDGYPILQKLDIEAQLDAQNI